MPQCAKVCEVYSRVCGYHRPIKNWNKGKKAEFADRMVYSMEKWGPALCDADPRATNRSSDDPILGGIDSRPVHPGLQTDQAPEPVLIPDQGVFKAVSF